MNVLLLGAGGPLAEAVIQSLESRHTLRLTDLHVEILEKYRPRHEVRPCDVSQPREVLEAAAGMDTIVNCTVNRFHPQGAFDVNCRGALNTMRAARAHHMRRVVHTGPQLIHTHWSGDYSHDWDLPDDVPPRPGTGLYMLTKYLGQEVCRVFAEENGLEVIALLFSNFFQPGQVAPHIRFFRPHYPYTVSWADAGEAVRCAVEVASLPRRFEVIDIFAEAPDGVFSMTKARRLLGWEPKDSVAEYWRRPPGDQNPPPAGPNPPKPS